jgi:hypothetical protein
MNDIIQGKIRFNGEQGGVETKKLTKFVDAAV